MIHMFINRNALKHATDVFNGASEATRTFAFPSLERAFFRAGRRMISGAFLDKMIDRAQLDTQAQKERLEDAYMRGLVTYGQRLDRQIRAARRS